MAKQGEQGEKLRVELAALRGGMVRYFGMNSWFVVPEDARPRFYRWITTRCDSEQ